MNISPWRLLLSGLLGVGLTVFLYWIYQHHPAWVWPWGAMLFLLLVMAALVALVVIGHLRRRQDG